MSDGTIGVAWYDTRHDKPGDGQLTTDYWLAYSSDGGHSWQQIHVGGPFDMNTAWNDPRNPVAGPGIGDYIGLAAMPDGFASVFTMARPQATIGKSQAFFANIQLLNQPPPARNCPGTTGGLNGLALGPAKLGMTRAAARRSLGGFSTRGRHDVDFFCGLRLGYPSPALLATLSASERRRVQGRVVLALTANTNYTLRGVPIGARLESVARALRTGSGYRIGLNTWYLAPDGPSTAVLKVRHGIIEEIGIADQRLTNSRRTASVFLGSFQ